MKTPEELLIALADAQEASKIAVAEYKKARHNNDHAHYCEYTGHQERHETYANLGKIMSEKYKARCTANRRHGVCRRACVMAGRKLKAAKS